MAANDVPPRTELRSASILVVDDNDVNCTLLRRRLEREGHRVTVAHDGSEALELIDGNRFDLVLLDIVMPGLSGIEVLRIVRERFSVSDLPVIMATSSDESADMVEAFSRGANDYVTKPFDFSVVMARVRTHLALRRAMEENRSLLEQVELRNQFIRKLFGRYVDNEIVSQLLEQPDALSMNGRKRRITVLMADLRGFTTMSESLPPESVVTLINNYLTVMTEAIVAAGGAIDDFFGDGILVLFGAPVDRPDHARAAVACALRMQMAIEEVNRRNAADGLPDVEMGVGIDTGEVVVGNIGSERRTKYGVVGRHVNLASRIESYTVGGQILISADTLAEAGGDVVTGTSLRVHPKGVPEPIALHSVRGMTGEGLSLSEIADGAINLPQPLAAQFAVVEGKDASGTLTDASVVALSSREALLCGSAPALLSNVKLHIGLADVPLAQSTLYGKVTESEAERFRVRFTSVPPEVAERIRRALRIESAEGGAQRADG